MTNPIPGGAAWLARRASTLFTLDPDGRILAVRDPAQTPPRLCLQRSLQAVTLHLRHDLDPDLAAELRALAAAEPPATPSADPPRYWERIRRLLAPVAEEGGGPIYLLPRDTARPTDATLVTSGTPEADAMLAWWRRDGLPAQVAEVGFVDADDIWAPWQMLLRQGEVASICQTARLGPDGAEVGLVTMPTYRGQGLAAAVTAAWSAHPALGERTLFYSTWNANFASQRVAAKLGLTHIAQDFRLT